MLIILYFLSKYVQTYNEQLFPWKNEPVTSFIFLKQNYFNTNESTQKSVFKMTYSEMKHKHS